MISHVVHLEDDPHLYNILRVALLAVSPSLILKQFTDGEQLLRYLAQTQTPVDVAVLDIRIPGPINGLEVARRIRQLKYPVQIIVTSAYSPPERRILAALNALFIAKPWNMRQLLRVMLKEETLEFPVLRTASGPPPASGTTTAPTAGVSAVPNIEKWLYQYADLVKTVLDVPVAAMLVLAKDGTALYSAVVSENRIPHNPRTKEMIVSLAGYVSRANKPILVNDIRASSTGAAQGFVGFAGIRFTVPYGGGTGVICALDTRVRDWRGAGYSILTKIATAFSEVLLEAYAVEQFNVHSAELNAYNATIAHDLKTPLSAIIGYSDLAQMFMADGKLDEAAQYLGEIKDAAALMTEMITNLLWLARLENAQAQPGVVAVEPLIESACMRVQYPARRRGVEIVLASDFPGVVGHEAWIEEIFANLLSNAIKYIGDENPQPEVRLTWGWQGEMVRFEVADNGIGIAEQDIPRLFKRFSRLNRIVAEGTGLGLMIVQMMVNRLGGEVGVESVPEQGSTFWFTLPAG